MEKKKADIPLTACKSSAVTGYGYDANSKTLAVQFKGGKTYRYADVPASVHAGFAEAKSVGKYVGSTIAGKYKSQS